jgi:hypothetical protein
MACSRWPISAILVLLFVSLLTCSSAVQAAEIGVSFTEVRQAARPTPGTTRVAKSYSLTLRGGNAISYSRTFQSKVMGAGDGQLGMPNPSSRNQSAWKVENRSTLIRIVRLPQHVEEIRVTKDTDTSCRATVSYHLKPGYKEFSVGRPETFLSAVSAENIVCQVSP